MIRNSVTSILRRLGWKSKHAVEPAHMPPIVNTGSLDLCVFGPLTRGHVGQVLMSAAVARALKQPLQVWFCSMGGDLLAALAIHDALRRESRAVAIATGDCQSSALVAFLGARHRKATSNTVFLRHEVTGDAPFPVECAALAELEKCPNGFFDPVTALAHEVIEEIL